jgi:integrase
MILSPCKRVDTATPAARLLRNHASVLAPTPIVGMSAAHIAAALRSLWLTSPEQARRTIGMVLRVFRYARACGLETANAADVNDALKELLPRTPTAKRHFAAMDYRDVPAFVRELRSAQTQGDALSPTVIEFILLTACRENEVCGMKRLEIDWQERVWTLPASRSKTNTERRVPLCDRLIALLIRQRGPESGVEPDPHGYVWPGRNGDGPVTGKSVYKYLTQTMGISATIHGFRSRSATGLAIRLTLPATTSRSVSAMPLATRRNAPTGARTASTKDG